MNTAQACYDLLFEKYSDICILYKDLCSSIEVALRALFNYKGAVEDLPSFTMGVEESSICTSPHRRLHYHTTEDE